MQMTSGQLKMATAIPGMLNLGAATFVLLLLFVKEIRRKEGREGGSISKPVPPIKTLKPRRTAKSRKWPCSSSGEAFGVVE